MRNSNSQTLTVRRSNTDGLYVRLREDVRHVLLHGQARIEREKVRTYWEAGRLIDRHILHYKERADLGSRVIQKLSEDLDISDRVLYQVLQFARTFRVLNARSKLVWAHYRTLARIPDEKKRLELAKRADRDEWTSRELEERVKRETKTEKRDLVADSRSQTPDSRFEPKLGKLHAYRVVETEQGLLLDLGFSTFIDLPALKEKRLKPDDIVEVQSKNNLVKRSDLSKTDLYTYQATVEKIVDGDTLWVRINLWVSGRQTLGRSGNFRSPEARSPRGQAIYIRQKLRLRGLDAPEIDTKEGQRAKRFVDAAIENHRNSHGPHLTHGASSEAQASSVLITTTKPDKYDRYLSDVWLTKPDSGAAAVPTSSEKSNQSRDKYDRVNLNKLLLEEGLARVRTDYSENVWTEFNSGRF